MLTAFCDVKNHCLYLQYMSVFGEKKLRNIVKYDIFKTYMIQCYVTMWFLSISLPIIFLSCKDIYAKINSTTR